MIRVILLGVLVDRTCPNVLVEQTSHVSGGVPGVIRRDGYGLRPCGATFLRLGLHKKKKRNRPTHSSNRKQHQAPKTDPHQRTEPANRLNLTLLITSCAVTDPTNCIGPITSMVMEPTALVSSTTGVVMEPTNSVGSITTAVMEPTNCVGSIATAVMELATFAGSIATTVMELATFAGSITAAVMEPANSAGSITRAVVGPAHCASCITGVEVDSLVASWHQADATRWAGTI